MVYAVAAAAILIAMILVLVRTLRGPTVFDRILGVNIFGTLTVMLIAVVGFLQGRPEFLDLALVYALINFIATIAVTKYMRFRDMGHGEPAETDTGDI